MIRPLRHNLNTIMQKRKATGPPGLSEAKKRMTDSTSTIRQLEDLLTQIRHAQGNEPQRLAGQALKKLELLKIQIDQIDRNGQDSSRNLQLRPSHLTPAETKSISQAPPHPPAIKNEKLRKAIFTHQGAVPASHNFSDELSYERFEWLGDAYIQVLATRLIWQNSYNAQTGRLSMLREILVKNETLASFCERYSFDKQLRLPPNISTPKGFEKVKGDVFEAYVGGVLADDPEAGFEKVEKWMRELWSPLLPPPGTALSAPNMNAKEELTRQIGGTSVKINYVEDKAPRRLGSAKIEYSFVVYVDGWGHENLLLGAGVGFNKKIAGNEAAHAALKNHPLIDELIEKKRAYDKTVKERREGVQS